jgi:hypothetical protein
MHWILAFAQLEHGCFLSHLTLRRRQVTQDRALSPVAIVGDWLEDGLWTLLSVYEWALARRAEYSSVILDDQAEMLQNDAALLLRNATQS